MFYDSIPQDILQKANTSTFSQDEKYRREQALKNKDFFYGKGDKYLTKTSDDVELVAINILEPIITKKTSLLYKNHVKRIMDGPKSSIDFLDNIYKVFEIDKFLKHVDLAAELTGTALVTVTPLEEGPKFYLYDASEVTAVSKGPDHKELEALSIVTLEQVLKKPINEVKQVLSAEVWTNDEIYSVIEGVKQSSITNELGYIPFVAFKGQEVLNQYLGHAPAKSIRQVNDYLNQQVTNLGYMIKMQSFTPIVVTGFENGDSLNMHPGRAISVPNGASVGTISLNPQIDKVLSTVEWIEKKIYETSSVPKVCVIGNDSSNSGRELLIKWAPVLEILEDKIIRYEEYELELANLILDMYDYEPINNIRLDVDKNSVLPFSPSDDKLESDIKLNLKTPVDELMRRNPELNPDTALDIIEGNYNINNQFSLTENSNDDGGLDV